MKKMLNEKEKFKRVFDEIKFLDNPLDTIFLLNLIVTLVYNGFMSGLSIDNIIKILQQERKFFEFIKGGKKWKLYHT